MCSIRSNWIRASALDDLSSRSYGKKQRTRRLFPPPPGLSENVTSMLPIGLRTHDLCAMLRRITGILMLAFLLPGCEDPGYGDGGSMSSAWDIPTEAYHGTVNGAPIVFQHLNYTTFRLVISGEMVEGEMNTERGFDGDENSTLYVLNTDRPEAEQAYFVRYSNGDVFMLDPQRKPIRKARFRKQNVAAP
jgi:hypothetical protein